MYSIVFITAFVTYLSLAQGQFPSCSTPSGGKGECKPIFDCTVLAAILSQSTRTPEDVDLLRRSHCGFDGSTPKVCCPELCYTPDWQEGNCISIYKCSHLANLLQVLPIPKDTLTYLQNSRCEGPDQYSVCCGPGLPSSTPPKKIKKCTATATPPDPRTECCGLDGTNDRIFGGKATSVDQYPWLALIEYRKDNRIKLLCGGSLISGRYVLTAGHCVAGPVLDVGTPVSVRLGEYDTSHEGKDCAISSGGGEECNDGAISVPIDTNGITVHPEYVKGRTASKNDIALIRLSRIAPYSYFVRPICLPVVDWTQNPPQNFSLIAAGWGAVSEDKYNSNIKLDVQLPFVPQDVCQPKYSTSRRTFALWKGQLCAGGIENMDTCKGDSGGPLMFQANKTYEIVGIVSFGPTVCGTESIPGVYTKVHEYLSWIRNNMKP